MFKKNKKKLIIFLFIAFTGLGILLPGSILSLTFSSELDKVKDVPANYYKYSSSAISKNLSAKLSEYEQIKLISGAWDSERIPVDISESTLSESAVSEMARNAISTLYHSGMYSYQLESSYDNWYSWDVQCYRCTEKSFYTYTAYCYIVTFYRYNNNEIHKVLITENGSLLAISNNCAMEEQHSFNKQDLIAYCKQRYPASATPAVIPYTKIAMELPSYDFFYEYDNLDLQTTNILVLNNNSITSKEDFEAMLQQPVPDGTETYYVYYATNSDSNILTIIPTE